MRMRMMPVVCLTVAWIAAPGCTCGPGQNPTDVELGDTAVVVIVNPPVNDANSASVPEPGTERAGVPVALGEAASALTDSRGLAVLHHLDAGVYPLEVGAGSLSVTVAAGELREIAVAQAGSSAEMMADVRYDFEGAEVITLDGGQPAGDVSAALSGSNRIVLVRGGRYTGDVTFNGSDVTLFGEGARGGQVVIEGNVVVNGSANRIRGTRIEGDLTVTGSAFALVFSEVTGAVNIDGSDIVLIENTLCEGAVLAGSGLTVLGNRGLAPLPAPDAGEGC